MGIAVIQQHLVRSPTRSPRDLEKLKCGGGGPRPSIATPFAVCSRRHRPGRELASAASGPVNLAFGRPQESRPRWCERQEEGCTTLHELSPTLVQFWQHPFYSPEKRVCLKSNSACSPQLAAALCQRVPRTWISSSPKRIDERFCVCLRIGVLRKYVRELDAYVS
jgi:hypothetical protein